MRGLGTVEFLVFFMIGTFTYQLLCCRLLLVEKTEVEGGTAESSGNLSNQTFIVSLDLSRKNKT